MMDDEPLGRFLKRPVQPQVEHDLLQARRQVARLRPPQQGIQGIPPPPTPRAVVIVPPHGVLPVQRADRCAAPISAAPGNRCPHHGQGCHARVCAASRAAKYASRRRATHPCPSPSSATSTA